MKPACHTAQRGFSLLLVMFFTGVAFLVLGGVLRWNSANSSLTERHSDYYATLMAAEAATEKVVARMSRDFQSGGIAAVEAVTYDSLIPLASEAGVWANYSFSGDSSDTTRVLGQYAWGNKKLQWKYNEIWGQSSVYLIESNARNTLSSDSAKAAVRQEVQFAEIPIFGFGVFYALDMEVNPSQDMTLTGHVHGNANIYTAPSNPRIVTFAGDVTSAHQILRQPHPNDPRTPPFAVNFLGAQDWNVSSLNLPIGTNNTPSELHKIIEIPPSPDPTTLLGKQRYYNKADLIIIVTNGAVIATGNAYNSFAPVPWASISSFVNTNVYYVSGGTTNRPFNLRENRLLLLTDVDIQQFSSQSNILKGFLGWYPTNLYVADVRTQPANTQSGVRLINCQTLPNVGLTFATWNPLYVQGHYNAPAADLGTTNTSATKPASLIADAITVLSGNWSDANSTNNNVSARAATDTTINAAIVAGIVPTNGDYSGGVENFIRLLEGWGGRTLTFNGSIVALYESQIAIGPWDPASNNSYSPPIRRYGFDTNFKNPAKLPPGTPYLRTLIRGEWAIIQAN